jgi:hypothetical protein
MLTSDKYMLSEGLNMQSKIESQHEGAIINHIPFTDDRLVMGTTVTICWVNLLICEWLNMTNMCTYVLEGKW